MKENKEQLKLLKSGNAEEKIEALNNLDTSDLSDEVVASVAELINDADKGVRNVASMIIVASQNAKFPSLIAKYMPSADISVRNLAGEILIKLGSLSVEPLINFNHENDPDTLKFMIDVMGLIGDQSSALFIMEILSGSENDNVILACIEALGNIHFEGAVDVMMLLFDRNELYKPTVVEGLGKIGSKAALDFLVSRYPNEDEVTKYSILESLGNLGDIDTYFFLLEEVMNVSGPLVLPLITSISILKQKYDLDIPFDNRMKNLLMFTISEGTMEHKKVAFTLIDSFDDRDILYASLKLLGDDYELDEMIRSKIFRNAGYIYREISRIINQNPPNLKHVLALFLATIYYVGEYGIQIDITMLDVRNIIHSVSGSLSYHDEDARRCAMEILFSLDIESALMFIDTMLSDENSWNRLRLLEIIENIPGEGFDSAIKRLTSDEDEMVRERAVEVANSRNINQESSNVN